MDYEYDWFKPFEDVAPEQEEKVGGFTPPDDPKPHALACKRYPVAKLVSMPALLPERFITDLEQNQKIASCCRHPEDHDIEAWYSDADHKQRGIPDIYILHCSCGRRHRRLMCGGGERPFWDIR